MFPDFFRDFPLELSTSGYKTARDRHGSKTLLREARFKLTDFERSPCPRAILTRSFLGLSTRDTNHYLFILFPISTGRRLFFSKSVNDPASQPEWMQSKIGKCLFSAAWSILRGTGQTKSTYLVLTSEILERRLSIPRLGERKCPSWLQYGGLTRQQLRAAGWVGGLVISYDFLYLWLFMAIYGCLWLYKANQGVHGWWFLRGTCLLYLL